MTEAFSNSDDIIDSRDVIERIAELSALGTDGALSTEEHDELQALVALEKEAADYAPDWHHGEALIRSTHFKDYAQDLAEECGMVTDFATWPNNCIDWDLAARELEHDYTRVDFDGVEYLIR